LDFAIDLREVSSFQDSESKSAFAIEKTAHEKIGTQEIDDSGKWRSS
jgi:hypothetical protein